LSLLVNAGSRTAAAAGLYHHTTRTDQTKDSSTVDIGFHYIGLNGSQPNDYDLDGIADYSEDWDGDGSLDSGEINWQSASDLGFSVFITEPKSNSNFP